MRSQVRGQFSRIDDDFGIFRHLVGVIDAGKAFQQTSSGPGVEPFPIACFANFNGCPHVNLGEPAQKCLFFELDVDHEFVGEVFQVTPQLFDRSSRRNLHPCLGLEQHLTGHGRTLALSLQFMNVDMMTGENFRNIVDDSGSILPYQFQFKLSNPSGGWWLPGALSHNLQAFGFKALQSGKETAHLLAWHAGQKYPGKFSCQRKHGAFSPVSAMLFQHAGERLYDSGPILTYDR